jgi:hypothetical protein
MPPRKRRSYGGGPPRIAERCGHKMRGGRICGLPSGHIQGHTSEQALRDRLSRNRKGNIPLADRCGEKLRTRDGKLTSVPCVRPRGHPGKLGSPAHMSATAQRERSKGEKAAKHGYQMKQRYGISEAEYWLIHTVQGGRCAICRRATGVTKRLSLDHDHQIEKTLGVRASVRGLLCSRCNAQLGHARDSIEHYQRGIDYLTNPPARKVLDNASSEAQGIDQQPKAEACGGD